MYTVFRRLFNQVRTSRLFHGFSMLMVTAILLAGVPQFPSQGVHAQESQELSFGCRNLHSSGAREDSTGLNIGSATPRPFVVGEIVTAKVGSFDSGYAEFRITEVVGSQTVNQWLLGLSALPVTFTFPIPTDSSYKFYLKIRLDSPGDFSWEWDCSLNPDSDGDGVTDSEDSFSNSNMDATVNIDDCDTGVVNTVFPNGATFNDLIGEAAANATNHGKFVSAVAKLTNNWKKAGLISGAEKGTIVSCAAQSDFP